MNLKEYEVQLALGTVDFRAAAKETRSSTVLQDIIGRTDDVAVLCAVATNPKANIYTLTLLATFPGADEGVIISCAHHPNTTLSILERWMKYPTIECIQAVQRRVRTLQLASGVPPEDALCIRIVPGEESPLPYPTLPDPFKGWYKKISDIDEWSDKTTYPPILASSKKYVMWTTTGNNTTIEMDDTHFKFVDSSTCFPYASSDIDVSTNT